MTPERKQQMLDYSRKLRKCKRKGPFIKATPEELKERKNARERAKRAAEREAGLRIDKRLKSNMTKPHYKTLITKPKTNKVRKPSNKKLMGKVVKEVEQMPTRQTDLKALIPLKLDAKTTIFIRPDQDPEAVRNKYLNRRL